MKEEERRMIILEGKHDTCCNISLFAIILFTCAEHPHLTKKEGNKAVLLLLEKCSSIYFGHLPCLCFKSWMSGASQKTIKNDYP